LNDVGLLPQFDNAVGRIVALAQAKVSIDQRALTNQAAGIEDSVAAGLGVVA
jgi:hypothetical protein